jgi:hypothetical protein
MKPNIRLWLGSAVFAGAILSLSIASAQQTQQKVQSGTTDMRAYDRARETVLEGTVTQYIASSTVPPLGARVILQTSSGSVSVHVGSDKFLEINKLTLSSGDAIRIVGEQLASGDGNIFVARIIQKGGQSLAIRSVRGFPLWRGAAKAAGLKTQAPAGGVL